MPPKGRKRVKEEALELPPEAIDIDPKSFFDSQPFLIQFLTKTGDDIAHNVQIEFGRRCKESCSAILDLKTEFKELCEEVSGKRSVPKTPKRSALSKISQTIALFDDAEQCPASAAPMPIEEECMNGTEPNDSPVSIDVQESLRAMSIKAEENGVNDNIDAAIPKPSHTLKEEPMEDSVSRTEEVDQKRTEEKAVTPASAAAAVIPKSLPRMKEQSMKENVSELVDTKITTPVSDVGTSSAVPSSSRGRPLDPIPAYRKSVKVKEEVVSPVSQPVPGVDHMANSRILRVEGRALAGRTTPVKPLYAHQHIISTPGKPDRKDHVQKVIAEQDRVRMRSPLRKPIVHHQVDVPTKKAPNGVEIKKNLIQIRVEQAAQAKNMIKQETADRLKQSNEARRLRVQHNQKKQEEQNRLEKEKKKAMREERVKSPSRLPNSRVGSPSRNRQLPIPTTPGAKLRQQLFHESPARTPGRGPAKVSKVTLLSGETSREGTFSSPAREVKRKFCNKQVDESAEQARLEQERLAQLEQERLAQLEQERLARQEKERLARQEKERLARQEKERLARQEQERLARQEQERLARQEQERFKHDEVKENQPHDYGEEQAPVKAPMQLHSKLQESVEGSYEMTPEKTFKPSTLNNYNIEDLSSGDETDDDSAPRKKVPLWADWSNLKKIAKSQHDPAKCYDVYGAPIHPESCTIFAKGSAKLKTRRGSSAQWNSPLEKPTKGKSRYLGF